MSSSSTARGAPGGVDMYAVFNAKLLDFVDDMQGILRHVPQYKMLVASIKLLSQFQPHQNHTFFRQYVATPYEASIVARDEAFLLNQDYNVGGEDVDIVSLVKGVWTSLTPEDKDSIWAHLQVLLAISRRI
jgi:hypothetical protein